MFPIIGNGEYWMSITILYGGHILIQLPIAHKEVELFANI